MMKLRPKDRVSFTPLPNGTVLLQAKNKSFADLRGLLAPEPGTRVSIDDMNLGKE
jgi:antitoxin PrlF